MHAGSDNQPQEVRLIRQPLVFELTGQSRSSLYEAINNGTFPVPVKIGGHAVAWVEQEVRSRIKARIAERDNKPGGTV